MSAIVSGRSPTYVPLALEHRQRGTSVKSSRQRFRLCLYWHTSLKDQPDQVGVLWLTDFGLFKPLFNFQLPSERLLSIQFKAQHD